MAGRKNEKEFDRLFREMFSRLCLYAESIVHDSDEAKDVVQQVFVQLWMNVDSYDWTRDLQVYLFRSVHNTAMNVIRHERVRYDFLEFIQHQGEDKTNPLIWEHDEQEHLIQRVNEVVKSMPEQMREVFLLSRFAGEKSTEIADQLSLSLRTVENQLYRAMKYLHEKLDVSDKKDLLLFLFFKKNHEWR